MMNQQFAEPEWQSAEQRNVNTDPREQFMYNPPPVNDFYQKIQPQPRRRRRLWPLFVVVIILGFLLVGGISAGVGFQNTVVETHTYAVSAHPTLVINDNNGSITIHRGAADSQLTIQANKHIGIGNAPSVEYNQSGNTMAATAQGGSDFGLSGGNVDFDVTVPSNTDLQLHTNAGSIDVNGVSGTMSLTTNAGSVTATQDTLSGQSALKSNAGSITFDGSIIANGQYEFATNAGSVNVTLPDTPAFHVDARTNAGSISSDFASVNRESNSGVGHDAHGDVGSSPTAQVTLQTNAGSIDIHRR